MSTIDIQTTQNVSIEYELASLRERILAFFIDVLIVILGFTALSILVAMAVTSQSWDNSLFLGVWYGVVPTVLLMIYHFLSEVLADGQSWGKKAFNLKVVRLDGEEPSLTDYLLRAVFHIVDSILSAGVVASFLVSSSIKNQRLGDLTANTTVIRVRNNIRFRLSDILNINSLENYEPKYPQVQQLSEQDMLLIKSVINRYRTFRNDAHEKAMKKLVDRMQTILEIEEVPRDREEFLRTLIRDYIVLTR